jgi:hypothetical protein
MLGIRNAPSGVNKGCQAGAVAHHRRVGELAAERLDLDAVSDGLKVTHWFLFLLVASNPVHVASGCFGLVLREASTPAVQPVSPGAVRVPARRDRGTEKRVMMSLSFLLAG